MTKGEYRVGITFNPSNDDTVGKIKRAAADLIDLIEGIPLPAWSDLSDGDDNHARVDLEGMHRSEVSRLKAMAQTAVEEGAMWAVKAATKPERGA
jgi:hypothetical protein